MSKNKKNLSTKVLEKEALRKRLLVKDVLYAYLLNQELTIAEAKEVCEYVHLIINATYSELMVKEQMRLSKLKLVDLELAKSDLLKKNDKLDKRAKELLNKFGDETVSVASDFFSGMKTAIDAFITEENLTRKLETVKATLL